MADEDFAEFDVDTLNDLDDNVHFSLETYDAEPVETEDVDGIDLLEQEQDQDDGGAGESDNETGAGDRGGASSAGGSASMRGTSNEDEDDDDEEDQDEEEDENGSEHEADDRDETTSITAETEVSVTDADVDEDERVPMESEPEPEPQTPPSTVSSSTWIDVIAMANECRPAKPKRIGGKCPFQWLLDDQIRSRGMPRAHHTSTKTLSTLQTPMDAINDAFDNAPDLSAQLNWSSTVRVNRLVSVTNRMFSQDEQAILDKRSFYLAMSSTYRMMERRKYRLSPAFQKHYRDTCGTWNLFYRWYGYMTTDQMRAAFTTTFYRVKTNKPCVLMFHPFPQAHRKPAWDFFWKLWQPLSQTSKVSSIVLIVRQPMEVTKGGFVECMRTAKQLRQMEHVPDILSESSIALDILQAEIVPEYEPLSVRQALHELNKPHLLAKLREQQPIPQAVRDFLMRLPALPPNGPIAKQYGWPVGTVVRVRDSSDTIATVDRFRIVRYPTTRHASALGLLEMTKTFAEDD